MSHKLFVVSSQNPNDTTGGGGCICSPERQPDCKPPYCVFPGNDMENIASPHVVVGAACVEGMREKLLGEIYSAGEVESRDDSPAYLTENLVCYPTLPAPVTADEDPDV